MRMRGEYIRVSAVGSQSSTSNPPSARAATQRADTDSLTPPPPLAADKVNRSTPYMTDKQDRKG